MYCEHCPTDGSRCGVCNAVGHCDHEAANRNYSRRVLIPCSVLLLACIVVAGICAAVNLSGGAK